MHPRSSVCRQRKVPRMHISRAVPAIDTQDSCMAMFSECVRLSLYSLRIIHVTLLLYLIPLSLENVCETYVVTCVFKERHIPTPRQGSIK